MTRISTLVARRTTAFMMALHLLVVIACAQTRKPAAEQNAKNPSNSSPVHYEIKPDSLPPPNATRSAVNPPKVVPMPEGATLALPPGFEVAVYAEGNLEEPRWLALAPNGDVFVAESKAGRITILRDANKDGTIDERLVFATGLTQPFGMAFWRDYFYVANTDSVVRFKYKPGQAKAEGDPEKIADLPGKGYRQHWTRNIIFSPDGSKMYVSVGSESNVNVEPDPRRAAISEYNPDGTNHRIFAGGLRNPVGMAFYPGTRQLCGLP